MLALFSRNFNQYTLNIYSFLSYAASTSTTILTQHLYNVHKINIKTHREETKQRKLTDIFLTNENEKSSTMTKTTDEKFILARRLIVWFCRDLMPFSSVENEGFRDFWSSLKRDTSLPTRANVSTNALDDIYKVLRERLILDLKSSGGTALWRIFI